MFKLMLQCPTEGRDGRGEIVSVTIVGLTKRNSVKNSCYQKSNAQCRCQYSTGYLPLVFYVDLIYSVVQVVFLILYRRVSDLIIIRHSFHFTTR